MYIKLSFAVLLTLVYCVSAHRGGIKYVENDVVPNDEMIDDEEFKMAEDEQLDRFVQEEEDDEERLYGAKRYSKDPFSLSRRRDCYGRRRMSRRRRGCAPIIDCAGRRRLLSRRRSVCGTDEQWGPNEENGHLPEHHGHAHGHGNEHGHGDK